jgi:hypothetical protein
MINHESVHYKIIFLDVDGVLNNKFIPREISHCIVRRIGRLVKSTGASIVISSTWRLKEKNRDAMKAIFLQCGVPMPISSTPYIETDSYKKTRVDEILTWLYLNSDNLCQEERFDRMLTKREEFTVADYILPVAIHVSHFVVLDDINLMKEGGVDHPLITEQHFVRTLMQVGFTETNEQQATRILDGDYKRPICPPKYCEHCHTYTNKTYDPELNKYFCTSQCQRDFYNLFITA